MNTRASSLLCQYRCARTLSWSFVMTRGFLPSTYPPAHRLGLNLHTPPVPCNRRTGLLAACACTFTLRLIELLLLLPHSPQLESCGGMAMLVKSCTSAVAQAGGAGEGLCRCGPDTIGRSVCCVSVDIHSSRGTGIKSTPWCTLSCIETMSISYKFVGRLT